MTQKSKMKARAKMLAETLIFDGDGGTIGAEKYARTMLEEVDCDERHDDGYLLYEMWEEVVNVIKGWG